MLIEKNVKLGPPLRLSAWRKVAMGTWKTAGDPSVYGTLELPAEPALEYIQSLEKKTGMRITLSHFAGRAMAETLKRHPEINCVMRCGKLYPRQNVDVFFQVATDKKGDDLSGMVIRNADHKSIPDISREMDDTVKIIRSKGDPSYKKMKNVFSMLPGWMAGPILTFSGWFMYSMNLWSPLFGAPKDSFGSVMVTNIGSLGLDSAYAPLVPYSRIPLLIAVGTVVDRAVVRNGAVVAGKTIKLCATFDHRIIDGVQASHMSRTLTLIFNDPVKELGAV